MRLIGKTAWNTNEILKLDLENLNHRNPVESLGNTAGLHTAWIIAMPYSSPALLLFSEAGFGRINVNSDYLIISATENEWHCVVKHLNTGNHKSRMIAALLVSTFPDLFKNLSRSLNSDGTLAIRG